MMFADTDWGMIVDKIGFYTLQIITLLLAGWAKIAAAKASKLAGQANQSAQQATEVSVQNQVKIDAGRKEAKEDLSTQTATLMNKIPEKVVAVVKTET